MIKLNNFVILLILLIIEIIITLNAYAKIAKYNNLQTKINNSSDINLNKDDLDTINIEVKTFEKEVVFIFYRNKKHFINFKINKNVVRTYVNMPVTFNLINEEVFNKYADNIKLTNNNQIIEFNLKNSVVFNNHIINGEKLDAFKCIIKEFDTNLLKLSNIKNDPDGITYKVIDNNNHVLSFNVGVNNSKIAAFIKDKYLWVIFDQKKIFSFKDKGILSNFKNITTPTGSVLKFKIDPRFDNVKVEKTKKGWNLNFSTEKDFSWQENKVISHNQSSCKDGFCIRENFNQNKIISFEDPDLKEIISVIPVDSVGLRIKDTIEYIDFNILPSIQGIVIIQLNDDIKITIKERDLIIISDTSLEEINIINNFPGDIEEFLLLPTLLPYIDSNDSYHNFNHQKSILISNAISEDNNNNKSFYAHLDLAKFFFAHGLYNESLAILNLIKNNQLYQDHLQARFLTAVSLTLTGLFEEGNKEYDSLLKYHDVLLIDEINLWQKYNNVMLDNNYVSTIGFLENFSTITTYYPNSIYFLIALADLKNAILIDNLSLAYNLMKKIVVTPNTRQINSNSLKYYQAMYYTKKNQIILAKELYNNLIFKTDDPFNSTRAKYELTKILKVEKEITLQEAIKELEKLKFLWRGDNLEYNILLTLADYYYQNNNLIDSLRTYKYIQTSFFYYNNFQVISEMTKVFNEIFLFSRETNKIDDFTLVALFYEFKELVPIGEKGDDIILTIIKSLVKLDLLENAIELLDHQITYRLKETKKVKNSDNLAIILMLNNQPKEAILVLDNTEINNFSFDEHEYRVRLRARAFIDLKEYDIALSYLKDDKSEDAEIMRKEALFLSNKWNDYINNVVDDLDLMIAEINNNPAVKQDLLRLAISYHMLNKEEHIQMIAQATKNISYDFTSAIDLLLNKSQSFNYQELEKSLNINQMQILLNKYKNQFLNQ